MRSSLTKILLVYIILFVCLLSFSVPLFSFFVSTWTSSPLALLTNDHCTSCCAVSRLRYAPAPRSNVEVEFELRKPPNLTPDTDSPILHTAAQLALILDHGFAYAYGHDHLEGGGYDLRRLYIRGRKCFQECAWCRKCFSKPGDGEGSNSA